ncbi:MAG: hypothetical protein L6V81_11125 [Clostridium sp.]|nr:MAG: hypothetical protein L6V81_11125 [Clostridium sp.]
MKFKMNNREWEVIELSQEEIREKNLENINMMVSQKEGKYFWINIFRQ